MLRLRRRSAAKTVAPFRITTRTRGWSSPAYCELISWPNWRTRRAMVRALIMGLPAPWMGGASRGARSVVLAVAGWARTSVIRGDSVYQRGERPDGRRGAPPAAVTRSVEAAETAVEADGAA